MGKRVATVRRWPAKQRVRVKLGDVRRPGAAASPDGPPPDLPELMDALLAVCNGKPWTFVPGRDRGKKETAEDVQHLVPKLRELLETAIRDREELSDQIYLTIAVPMLSHLHMQPALHHSERFGWKYVEERIYPNFETALKYAVMTLLNEEQPYGATLRRCRYDKCGDFYFARKNPKGGPLNMQYCNPDHREEANNDKAQRAPRKPK